MPSPIVVFLHTYMPILVIVVILLCLIWAAKEIGEWYDRKKGRQLEVRTAEQKAKDDHIFEEVERFYGGGW